MDKPNNKMSRKEFLKKSSAAFLGIGLFGKITSRILGESPTKTNPAYRILGRSGIRVTPVGFGATRTMEPALAKSALEKGINFLDTGRSYFNGQNEVMVGKVIKGMRKDFVIQSKIRINIREQGEHLKSAEVSRRIKKEMATSLEESLKALQTDYIDIMLFHGASSVDIIHHEAIMEFFEEAKKAGKIRSRGFSSHVNQAELLKASNESKFYDVIMVAYNHKGSYIHWRSRRYSEWDQPAMEIELEKARKNGIGLVAMKTCSAGPYSPDEESKPSFEAALKWILSQGKVHTMAVAMANFKEIEENIRAMF